MYKSDSFRTILLLGVINKAKLQSQLNFNHVETLNKISVLLESSISRITNIMNIKHKHKIRVALKNNSYDGGYYLLSIQVIAFQWQLFGEKHFL